MQYRIIKTPEYEDWLKEQTKKSRVQIEKRLSKIETEGHFGDHKGVGENVCELKWLNGRRLYYALIPEENILVLTGGNKNGQSKDINEAEKILRRYVEDEA